MVGTKPTLLPLRLASLLSEVISVADEMIFIETHTPPLLLQLLRNCTTREMAVLNVNG